MEELKCPHCGSEYIDYDDCIDSEYCDDTVIRKYCGYCMDCGTNLTWEEEFKFKQYNNIIIDN